MGTIVWVRPQFSKGQVDRSARALVTAPSGSVEHDEALQIVNNWRASHNFPLNTFQVTLRKKASDVETTRLVAQRIKRMTSIEAKLLRFPGMRMTQMQDIGGCRVILNNVKNVNRLVAKYKESDIKHKLDDTDDYIASPKASGYRGVHMVYRYFSDREGPSAYNGLFVEMQIRTKPQHTWATAVETVGTFLSQALKSSSGEEKWLRFFALMGSVYAIKERCQTLVPDTPSSGSALVREVRRIERELNVQQVLSMYQQAIQVAQEGAHKNNHYYLMVLEPADMRMTVKGYPKNRLEDASKEYLRQEERVARVPGAEAVLVSVDSIQSLQRAYPNYFLDTGVFLSDLRDLVVNGI